MVDTNLSETSGPLAATPSAPVDEKVRDRTLDSLRGLLIVLVVFGHFPERQLPPGPLVNIFDNVASFIYLFHIPTFFVLSGILLRRPRTMYDVVKAQLPLLITFAFWSLISRRDLIEAKDWAGVLKLLFLGNFPSIHGVMWFLPALISVRLVVSAWLGGNLAVRTLMSAAVVLVVANPEWFAVHNAQIPYGLALAFYLLPTILMCRWAYKRLNGIDARRWIAVFAIGFAAVTTLLFILEPREVYNNVFHRIDLAQFNVAKTIFNYGLLCASVLLLLCTFAAGLKAKIFEILGVFSLAIFVLHPKLMTVLAGKWPLHGPDAWQLASTIAIIAMCCILPIMASLLAAVLQPTLAHYLGLAPQREFGLVASLRARLPWRRSIQADAA